MYFGFHVNPCEKQLLLGIIILLEFNIFLINKIVFKLVDDIVDLYMI